MARLLPLVAEDPRALELRDRDLRLPRPVRAHQADVLAGPQRALRNQDLPAGRHRDDGIRGQRLLEAAGDADAEIGRHGARPFLVDVPQDDVTAERLEGSGRGTPVHADADHSCVSTGRLQRLGRQHRRRTGAKSGHRSRVQNRLDEAGLGVREDDEPVDGRQSALGIARKRRDPLQQGMAAAERGHGAEVAGRIVRDVQLRLHRPFAACVRHERVPNGVVGPFRRDCRLHVPRGEERDHRYRVLTAVSSCSTACFASPKSIEVRAS